jgi:DNA polymerase-3 subunit chi
VTTVAFHFNAPDRLDYTCRLLRKAVSAGAYVVVIGAHECLARLDRDLWILTTTGFVPHCGADAPPQVIQRSPVLFTETLRECVRHEVLVNLGESIPDGFEQFDRVIEVVGQESEDRRTARTRWKAYQKLNLQPIQYDLALAQSVS